MQDVLSISDERHEVRLGSGEWVKAVPLTHQVIHLPIAAWMTAYSTGLWGVAQAPPARRKIQANVTSLSDHCDAHTRRTTSDLSAPPTMVLSQARSGLIRSTHGTTRTHGLCLLLLRKSDLPILLRGML